MITKAFGPGDELFKAEEIKDPLKLARMQTLPLYDAEDMEVEPVRESINGKSAHFRRKKEKKMGNQIGLSENKPDHNAAVDDILEELSTNKLPLIFTSLHRYKRIEVNIDGEKAKVAEPIDIGNVIKIADYRWFKESRARIWLDAERYIQPDLMGCDSLRASPTPSTPAVVIEVIRTHPPEFETYLALRDASTRNHLILFFFIAGERRNDELNSIELRDDLCEVRAQLYLKNGFLYQRDEKIEIDRSIAEAGPEVAYQHLINTRFNPAMTGIANRESRRGKSYPP
ncbi:hypothetical protein [Xanthomonas euvesicatoria]|uniref:hypothetical protein n=2 Tax=Xanthomonas euvesicatoria TaxID=456327 RepID=UPI00053B647C|nr:hypothetical protein [Xanthomonas euvesicatoria]QTK46696.1 hypothetical protein XeaCFBP3836p_16045 [Xanthomonas euvesicatoria pv. alfalfae]